MPEKDDGPKEIAPVRRAINWLIINEEVVNDGDVAKRLGMSTSTLSGYVKNPAPSFIDKLEKEFKINIEDFEKSLKGRLTIDAESSPADEKKENDKPLDEPKGYLREYIELLKRQQRDSDTSITELTKEIRTLRQEINDKLLKEDDEKTIGFREVINDLNRQLKEKQNIINHFTFVKNSANSSDPSKIPPTPETKLETS